MRKGFTVVELLITISIIAILATMTTMGIASIMDGNRKAQTRIAIASAQSILHESMRHAAPKTGPWYDNGVRAVHSAAVSSFWKSHREVGTATYPVLIQAGRISDTSDLMRNTVIAMRVLSSNALAARAISAMPSSSLRSYPTLLDKADGTTVSVNAPVMLDAWGNPLLFSPSSGMFIGTIPPVDGQEVITSTKNANTPGGEMLFTTAPLSWPMQGMTPFFFSAGPDGDPTTAADNLYPWS